MIESSVSRRNFSKLTLAAAAGIVAGSTAARAQGGSGAKKVAAASGAKTKEFPVDPSLLLQEPNVCRGLNSCKGKGKGEHACAGQGACASVAAHSCNGTNDCKGQGGCGGYPGQNTCKGHGHCAVPLTKDSWALARKQYEHLMKDLGTQFGAAPQA